MTKAHSKRRKIGGFSLAILLLAPLMVAVAVQGRAQSQSQQPAAPQQPAAQQPDQQAPDAGGPSGDNGPIALPKKPDNSDNTPPPAPARPEFKNPEGAPNMSLRVEVPEVTVDVGVLLEKTHQFVPGLKPSNFRVYEDGVEQKVEGFKRTEAPITVLILMEYAARGYCLQSGCVEFGVGVYRAVAAAGLRGHDDVRPEYAYRERFYAGQKTDHGRHQRAGATKCTCRPRSRRPTSSMR